MPFEYGTTLLDAWSCEEIPELVDDPIDTPVMNFNYNKEISFTAEFKISKWFKRYMEYGWKARGPVRKRLLEKIKKRYLTYTTYLFERKEGEDYFEYKGSAF